MRAQALLQHSVATALQAGHAVEVFGFPGGSRACRMGGWRPTAPPMRCHVGMRGTQSSRVAGKAATWHVWQMPLISRGGLPRGVGSASAVISTRHGISGAPG